MNNPQTQPGGMRGFVIVWFGQLLSFIETLIPDHDTFPANAPLVP